MTTPAHATLWHTTRHTVDLSQPRVMAIVNCTPDSFADDQVLPDAAAALARCEAALREGADLLDIGGESTRPGAAVVPVDEELRRVLPVLRGALTLGVPVSVDTCKPAVMQAALDLGVDIVNDITALRDPAALALLATHGRAGVCLMHLRGTPQTMSTLADYGDVVQDVLDELGAQLQRAQAAGVAATRIVLDPGYGFAKKPPHSWALLAAQQRLLALGRPLLVGLSRKGLIGAATGRPPQQRGPGSVAAALLAVDRGARVLRVHDVAATVDALKVWQAVTGTAPTTG